MFCNACYWQQVDAGVPHPYRLIDTIETMGELLQNRPTAVWRNLSYYEQAADMLTIARQQNLDASNVLELINGLDRSSQTTPPPP